LIHPSGCTIGKYTRESDAGTAKYSYIPQYDRPPPCSLAISQWQRMVDQPWWRQHATGAVPQRHPTHHLQLGSRQQEPPLWAAELYLPRAHRPSTQGGGVGADQEALRWAARALDAAPGSAWQRGRHIAWFLSERDLRPVSATIRRPFLAFESFLTDGKTPYIDTLWTVARTRSLSSSPTKTRRRASRRSSRSAQSTPSAPASNSMVIRPRARTVSSRRRGASCPRRRSPSLTSCCGSLLTQISPSSRASRKAILKLTWNRIWFGAWWM